MKKIISIAVLMVFCFSMAGVKAITLDTPDSLGGQITVSGSLDSKKPENPVTVQVFRPGFDGNIDALASSILSGQSVDLTSKYAFAGETTSKEQGSFSFEFNVDPLITGAGYYTVVVSSIGETKKTTGFYAVTDNELNPALAALNACNNKDDVEALFEQDSVNHYVSYLGFTAEEFDTLSDCDLIFGAIASWLNENEATKDNLGTVVDVFRCYTGICALNEATASDEAKVITDKYGKEMGIPQMTAYATYADTYFSDTYRNEVIAALYGKNLKSKKDLEDAFNTVAILRALHNLVSWNDAYDKVVFPNKGILTKIDYAAYSAASNKSNPKKAITKRSFTTLLQMQDAFNKAITKPGSENSGGGGGGGREYTVEPFVGTPSVNGLPFTDIANSAWAHESIKALYNAGVINGLSETQFAPDAPVTREQFIKMLVEGFGINDANAVCDFEDVQKGAWYESYIATAYQLSLTSGISDAQFGVGSKITREDMAVFAYRFLNSVNAAPEVKEAVFGDGASINGYAKDAVGALSGAGIINGMGDGNFAPQEFATRAQAAKIIFSVLALAKKI